MHVGYYVTKDTYQYNCSSSLSRSPSQCAEHSQLLAFRVIYILRHNAANILDITRAGARRPSRLPAKPPCIPVGYDTMSWMFYDRPCIIPGTRLEHTRTTRYYLDICHGCLHDISWAILYYFSIQMSISYHDGHIHHWLVIMCPCSSKTRGPKQQKDRELPASLSSSYCCRCYASGHARGVLIDYGVRNHAVSIALVCASFKLSAMATHLHSSPLLSLIWPR